MGFELEDMQLPAQICNHLTTPCHLNEILNRDMTVTYILYSFSVWLSGPAIAIILTCTVVVRIIGPLGKYEQKRWQNKFVLYDFHSKNSQKSKTIDNSKTTEHGEKSHYEINIFFQ